MKGFFNRVIMAFVVALIALGAYSYISDTSGNYVYGLVGFVVVFAAFYGTLKVIFKKEV